MFKIYGGHEKFTQWTKNNKLIMSKLPVGAEVLFYNDPKEDEPRVAEVYEFQEENGTKINVVDVPNNLLTETNKIKVRVPEKVKSLYGVIYMVAGQREKYFEVEAASKPDDYIYDNEEEDGCGCSGEVSEEQVVNIVNNYFSEDYEYVPNSEVIALLSDY